ncbi:hypothetical protein BJ912DRAFT_931873 [Pholiota molesta]|nr:hypothetical protein BJ912DRAFT_931873 [Pholiota molesta]
MKILLNLLPAPAAPLDIPETPCSSPAQAAELPVHNANPGPGADLTGGCKIESKLLAPAVDHNDEHIDDNLVIVIDAEGYGTCPDCHARIHCGSVGAANITKRHLGSQVCKSTKAKQDAKEVALKKKKSPLLTSFFGRANKPTTVLSTIPRSMPIQTPPLKPNTAFPANPIPPSNVSLPKHIPFLEKLHFLIQQLPMSIPEALDSDNLAVLSGHPENIDDPSLDADELWENVLNQLLKSVFGWGAPTEKDLQSVIRRGRKGLDGLYSFVRYFVVKRGVSEALFEGKLDYVIGALEKIVENSTISNSVHPQAPCNVAEKPNVQMVESDDEIEVIEQPPRLRKTKISVDLCKGYKMVLPDGMSPYTSYPFALHDILSIPWVPQASCEGNLILRARMCSEWIAKGTTMCQSCQQIGSMSTLDGILTRLESGVHENATFAYHGISGLQELLRRKNELIEFYRLHGLNQARKLLGKVAALSDQKRLLMAISSGKVKRVDRVISIALQQKKGVRGILASVTAAAQGYYQPKSYTEEEDMRALLIWKLSGNRVAEINHRLQGAPSVTYLRTRSIVPPLIPSPGQPKIQEVRKNVKATLESVLDEINSVRTGKVLHSVLMFDELATEKRIRWDPKTNNFLGICRQHAHKTSLEFTNEGDLTELFRHIDSGAVHYAGEATIGALGILCKDNRIYPGCPVLISGDCKNETGRQHTKLITTTLTGVDSEQKSTKIRTVSISTDDWKHVFKRFRNLFLRQRGVVIKGFRITPDIIREHLRSEGKSADHIRSLFNPEDQQDVKLAFDMLKDIWTLPRVPSNSKPGFSAAREALWMLGKLLYHMVFLYLCVDLSLSEQIEHLSAAAHLAIALYKLGGKDFLPTNLYIDLMLMIKNVLFCVAKAKADDPNGEFWIILLGTDRLEELFGILRTMIGNDANLDILQLVSRLSSTTEISNILAKYPQWDRSPRRLKLPTLSRQSTEIPNKADHIKPASWQGNVKAADETDESQEVSLVTTAPTDMATTDAPDSEPAPEGAPYTEAAELRIEVEEAFAELIDPHGPQPDAQGTDSDDEMARPPPETQGIDHKVFFEGKKVLKARAITLFSNDPHGFADPRRVVPKGTTGRGTGQACRTLAKPVPAGRVCGYGNPSAMRLDAAQRCICSADWCHILASLSHVIHVVRVALSSASSTPTPVVPASPTGCIALSSPSAVVRIAHRPHRPSSASSRQPYRLSSTRVAFSSTLPVACIVEAACTHARCRLIVVTWQHARISCGAGAGIPEAVGREWVSVASEDEGRRGHTWWVSRSRVSPSMSYTPSSVVVAHEQAQRCGGVASSRRCAVVASLRHRWVIASLRCRRFVALLCRRVLAPSLVLGSPVSRLEKNRDWTGTEPEMTGKLMDRKRPRPRSGPRSNRFEKTDGPIKNRSGPVPTGLWP